MSHQMELMAIAVVVAIACALPGVFLILRRLSLMSDAISHALLPGLVVAYLYTRDMGHPLLVVAAVVMGLLTVTLTEVLSKSRRVHADAAIGLVFPFLFSIGVLLVARYAGKIHLDTDAVLLGELAFAPFHRLTLFGADLGPKALWTMGGILAVSLTLILLFYKELKVSTFDAGLAAAMGFAPALLHWGLMLLVSVTAVGAFDAVGSILVVALMVVPGSTAFLLTRRLGPMLGLSALFAASGAVLGCLIAGFLDASIAGSMAATGGVLFVLVFVFAPDRGLVAQFRRKRRLEVEFGLKILLVHLLHHRHDAPDSLENRTEHLMDEVRWSPAFAHRVVTEGSTRGLVMERHGVLALTPDGLEQARLSMES